MIFLLEYTGCCFKSIHPLLITTRQHYDTVRLRKSCSVWRTHSSFKVPTIKQECKNLQRLEVNR